MSVSHRPQRHVKGWGYEDWIVNNDEYCGKILYFEREKRCSVHYHKKKRETFYLQSGRLEIVLASSPKAFSLGRTSIQVLNPGESMEIRRGLVHQIIALEDSFLFEFSTHHDESDSYRLKRGDQLPQQ